MQLCFEWLHERKQMSHLVWLCSARERSKYTNAARGWLVCLYTRAFQTGRDRPQCKQTVNIVCRAAIPWFQRNEWKAKKPQFNHNCSTTRAYSSQNPRQVHNSSLSLYTTCKHLEKYKVAKIRRRKNRPNIKPFWCAGKMLPMYIVGLIHQTVYSVQINHAQKGINNKWLTLLIR